METVRGVKMPNEIGQQYGVHPVVVGQWKKELVEKAATLFDRKRVQRLMELAGMAPGTSTSVTHPAHQVYPYLLRGLQVCRPNQVWSADSTYVRLSRGFVYLVAIIDWYSRRVLAWRISNSLDTAFCVNYLEDALSLVGKPEFFSSDQGSQFTSAAFTVVLKREGVDAPWTTSPSNGCGIASSTRRCI